MDLPPRQLLSPAFPDDDGSADPRVVEALAAFAEDRSRYGAALAALAPSRLLVPVVAVLGEVETGPDGLARDKTSDMAAVLLTGAGGRRALLAFTSTATLETWDPAARPAPVTARLAALTAVQEEADALLVDVAGPVKLVVEGRDLERLAAGWTPTRVGEHYTWIRPETE